MNQIPVDSDLRRGVVVVVGNPKPLSRTLGVATTLGRRLAEATGAEAPRIIDLARLGARLFDPEDQQVLEDLSAFRRARVAVVASPTYKASFTGLLKLFLDRIPTGGLAGVVSVPVMTGGAAFHSLAVDVHLRPVLLELGATLPTRGLYVLESQLPELDSVLETWWATAASTVEALAIPASLGVPA
jgi:FMN reductase